MRGQWIGTYEGSLSGGLMINIDEVDDHYEGVAYVNPNVEGMPSTVAHLSTNSKASKQKAIAFLNPVDPRTGYQCDWEDIKDLFPKDVQHSKQAKVNLQLKDGKLTIHAVSDIGVILNSTIEMPPETVDSRVKGKELSWSKFKDYITNYASTRFLFRGQKKPWRLRTSFHRRGRYRISEFTSKDVKQLHQRLSAITDHYFDLTVPEQNGAFFNLLQHHGYPTPLLDWSYSPYVAAFFAFRDWPIKNSEEGKARIYIFNNHEWQSTYPQILNLDPSSPHLSVMEFIALDNPRLVPQQAVTTITNLDDIEAYVQQREVESGATYLKAIDIPAT